MFRAVKNVCTNTSGNRCDGVRPRENGAVMDIFQLIPGRTEVAHTVLYLIYSSLKVSCESDVF